VVHLQKLEKLVADALPKGIWAVVLVSPAEVQASALRTTFPWGDWDNAAVEQKELDRMTFHTACAESSKPLAWSLPAVVVFAKVRRNATDIVAGLWY
jgi:hypothetical protein